MLFLTRISHHYLHRYRRQFRSWIGNCQNLCTNNSSEDKSTGTSKQGQNGKQNSPRKSISLRGPVSYTALGLTVLSAIAIVIYYNLEKEKRSEKVSGDIVSVGKPALGGPWVLVDHNGLPVTDAAYRGKYLLLYFGFTYCPDICPNELVKIGRILALAKKRNVQYQIKPIFISVDPSRDSVGQLREYKRDFHQDIDFLTGTPDQIASVTKAFRVYFSKAHENDGSEDYLVDHSIVLYLISPEGEFLDFFTQKMQVADIVERIDKHARQGSKVK